MQRECRCTKPTSDETCGQTRFKIGSWHCAAAFSLQILKSLSLSLPSSLSPLPPFLFGNAAKTAPVSPLHQCQGDFRFHDLSLSPSPSPLLSPPFPFFFVILSIQSCCYQQIDAEDSIMFVMERRATQGSRALPRAPNACAKPYEQSTGPVTFQACPFSVTDVFVRAVFNYL